MHTKRIAAALAVIGLVVGVPSAVFAAHQSHGHQVLAYAAAGAQNRCSGAQQQSAGRQCGQAPRSAAATPAPGVLTPPPSALFDLSPTPIAGSSPPAAGYSSPSGTGPSGPAASARAHSALAGLVAPGGTPDPSDSPTATASGPLMPDGVPAAQVGQLVVNDSATDIWRNWDYTSPLEGADCDSFGTIALSSAALALTTSGQFGNCAKITSSTRYGYGIFEARIKAQAGPDGTIANWPAFYLSGPNWPVGGEIDAFEAMGGYDAASFHYGADNSSLSKRDPVLKPGWNVVDVVWKRQALAVYYNGHKFVEWDSPVITSQPMWITFDNTTGTYGYTTGQPSTMLVDYLRIWTAV